MVTAKQYGGLGNRLFQRAAAIGYGVEHDKIWIFAPVKNTPFKLHKESSHSFTKIPEYRANLIVLDGYFQSEKYFAHCREKILKEFGFKWELHKGWCSVHVRRGDYLKYPDKHPVVTATYLNKAINYIISHGINQFIFFSDDIDWCRSYVQVGEWDDHITIRYSEGLSETADLELMSCCEHNIISNSTFSWWGAWLNQNPDKIVVSPSKDNWFGPGNDNLDTTDIIPDSWIQIKY